IRIHAIQELPSKLPESSGAPLSEKEERFICCPKASLVYNCEVKETNLLHRERLVGCIVEGKVDEETRTRNRDELQRLLEKDYKFVVVLKEAQIKGPQTTNTYRSDDDAEYSAPNAVQNPVYVAQKKLVPSIGNASGSERLGQDKSHCRLDDDVPKIT
ncbi:hypothetical protein CSKR_100280, partial [Clonorchis sinensis]